MRVLYDTRTVHPLDRYDHYRVGVARKLAPVEIRGRAPGQLLAVQAVAQVSDFEIGIDACDSDSEIGVRRTERLIRAGDPGCYRLCMGISGSIRTEQAGNQLILGARDIAFFNLSRPFGTTLGATSGMRGIMLSFPRALMPIAEATVRQLGGTRIPRSLPGHSLVVQFLFGLVETADQGFEPGLADVLRECVVGLIRQRLGHPHGMSPHTCRLLLRTHVRNIMRQRLGDPAVDVAGIARAANLSTRNLHKLFEGTDQTPMQLLKQLRLEQCHRSMRDPALAGRPIRDVIAVHGYRRPDQFARDFRQHFGVSATQIRELAGHQRSDRDR